jgi:hypothetical protein
MGEQSDICPINVTTYVSTELRATSPYVSNTALNDVNLDLASSSYQSLA